VQAGLGALLRTASPVFPVLAAGTTALEVALRGVARRRVLVVANGAFGQRLGKISTGVGVETEILTVPHGDPVDPALMERALAGGEFDTVAVVHSETSTGALSDVAALARVVGDRGDVAFVVDAMSSLGAVDLSFDDLGPAAVLVSGTSKAMACPPGMSILAVGPGAAARAEDSERGGYALDLAHLIDFHGRGDVPNTPNTPLFHALDVQLAHIAEEGLAARAARHDRMAERVRAWAEERFAVLAQVGARSPTVTVVENTRALDVPRLLSSVEERGFRIADGYGVLKGATFRIGHMGDVTPEQVEALLAALDDALPA